MLAFLPLIVSLVCALRIATPVFGQTSSIESVVQRTRVLIADSSVRRADPSLFHYE